MLPVRRNDLPQRRSPALSDDVEDFYLNDPIDQPERPEDLTAAVGSARSYFGWAESGMRALGLRGAADNLARYRSGEGGTREYSDDEIGGYGRSAAMESCAGRRIPTARISKPGPSWRIRKVTKS